LLRPPVEGKDDDGVWRTERWPARARRRAILLTVREAPTMNLSKLSIGTFNLYNLNEPGLALYRDRDGWSQSEYERKIE
jgi:hypothetical protein